jgi:hypothetical protein
MTKDELTNILDSWDSLTLMKMNVEGHPDYLPGLMDIALNGRDRHSWRAAWIADKINEQHPGIMEPWIGELTKKLRGTSHSGKKRQYLKLVSLYPIAEEQRSFLMDYCLQVLESAAEPPGVKAHAMQVLYNISEYEPELKEELLQILEFELEIRESAGVRARARRLAEKLAREVRMKR